MEFGILSRSDAFSQQSPRLIANSPFDIAPSCLGFGCASLGSRIAATAGLRALAESYERGVTWFDVAPAYGNGQAETILARFLVGRRDKVIVTTKVGIAPPQRRPAMTYVYALGRPLIGAAKDLRRVFRKVSATRNRRVPIDGALVERSIADSLKRLQTDRVDVYALHDPDPEAVARDDVLRALERTIERGQTRHVAVAGGHEACIAARQIGGPFTLLQMSTGSFDAHRAQFETAPSTLVLHSVFGVDGSRDRLIKLLKTDPSKVRRLVACGYGPDLEGAASDLLMDNAFALNPGGIVLSSMFDARHLAGNLARSQSVKAEAIALLREALA